MQKPSLPLINEKIRAPRVQVITSDGENIGVINRQEALRMAQDAGLDLVLLADKGAQKVPVVKIMDFGKALYERKKKQSEAKKHQKVIQIKEVKMRPKIGEHDFMTKLKRAIQFLESGKRVKFTLSFRGRENISKQERGQALFAKIDEHFASHEFNKTLVHDKDTIQGQLWSRVYYLK